MTFLDEVKDKLDLPPAEKEQVMRELESHYHEIEDEAMDSGMNECEAATEAAKRLGDPSDIAQRMQTVHCRATWKTAMLTALPFLGFAIINLFSLVYRIHIINRIEIALLIIIMICVSLMIGSLRELKADRRPLWLATWLPAGLMLLTSLIFPAIRGLIHLNLSNSYLVTQGTRRFIIEMTLRNSIEILLIGSLLVWAYWGSKRLKSTMIGIIVTGLLIYTLAGYVVYTYLYNFGLSLGFIRGLFYVVISMLLAVKLFMRNPYGNVIQASLMLYVFLDPGYPMKGIGEIHQRFWFIILHFVISALVIMLLARTPQRRIKQWILSTIIIITGMAASIVSLYEPGTPTFNNTELIDISLTVTIVNLIWIVFVPVLIDRYYKKRNPEFAH